MLCISLLTNVGSSVRSVRGASVHALQLRRQSRRGDMGRCEASQTVGVRWIDGLWPTFCLVNWESVLGWTGFGRLPKAVPSKGGPVRPGVCAVAVRMSSMGSEAGSD